MRLKCLIVDDEPLAHKVLENYISKLTTLELCGSCYNAFEALNFLMVEQVDILFLDINMPELNGLDMLRSIDHPPRVILTTAYSEYALESYEIGVVDYLMKPIRFDRFIKGINKVIKLNTLMVPKVATTESQTKKTSIFIKVDGIQQNINLDELDYIESRGNFVQLHLGDKRYLTAETLSNMDKRLHQSGFLRIHKSYIINVSKVESIQGKMIKVGSQLIPIGNSYRQIVKSRIG